MKILLEETKFDILAVTETRLGDVVIDSEVTIEGYISFRKDRTGKKKWEGTLIYYKEHMSSSSNSPLRFNFARLMSKSNLYNIIKSPTRITDCSNTIIDLAITSDPSKVKVSGSYKAGISDHNLIYVTINILIQNPPPRIIEVKFYSDVNKNDFQFDLDATPSDLISLFEDVDDAVSV